jgi:hypothetical protein
VTIEAYKVGPGTLTLGSGPLNVSAQVLSCSVEFSEKVKETDPVPTLSGEELPGSSSASLTFRLKGKVLQDLAAAALVDYSYTNAGDTVAFKFTPNTAEDRAVNGFVRVIPFTIGGDVSKTDSAQSDFDWTGIGGIGDADNPLTFGDATP